MESLVFRGSTTLVSLLVKIALKGQLCEKVLKVQSQLLMKVHEAMKKIYEDSESNSVMRHFWNSTAQLRSGKKRKG